MDDMHPSRPLDPECYKHLPRPVPLDETRTSREAGPPAPEGDDALRESAWLLRNAAG